MKEISAYIRSVRTYYRIDRYLKLYNVTKKPQITQESNHSLYECFASNMRYHWHYILGNINIIYMNVITRIYFFFKKFTEKFLLILYKAFNLYSYFIILWKKEKLWINLKLRPLVFYYYYDCVLHERWFLMACSSSQIV